MPPQFILVLLLFLTELYRARRVIDGQTNVYIDCNFDRGSQTRISQNYWVDINGKLYSPRNLPPNFDSGEQSLTILRIKLQMGNLSIICFSINETGRRDVGLRTVLQVLPGTASPSRPVNPFIKDLLTFIFQTLSISQDSNELHLGVTNSTCALQVSVYVLDETNDLQLHQMQNITGSANSFTVDLRNPGRNLVRVSAIDSGACTSTHYLLVGSPTYRMVMVTPTENSISFDLPVIRRWISMQLIWSSADSTQRVCPPNQLIRNCAHNEGDNVVTISSGRVHVANITLDDLKLSFVRLSRRCTRSRCIITESVVEVVRIISGSNNDCTTTQADNATATTTDSPKISSNKTEIHNNSAQGGKKPGTFSFIIIFCAILAVMISHSDCSKLIAFIGVSSARPHYWRLAMFV